MNKVVWPVVAAATAASLVAGVGSVQAVEAPAGPAAPPSRLEASCTAEAAQAVASTLAGETVSVKPIPNGMFRGATRYVPAKGVVPAYCQVVGSFVTNPATGKTANFLATFPERWNRKYLQLGCSGLCGQFYVSDPSSPAIVVTAQGVPGQIISKGYASFATDQGHVGMDTKWAVKGPGQVDQDAITDLYYRADKVLAHMGKAFAVAFYARLDGKAEKIERSYFSGCSGGGHDAFVAAAHFPEEFDGIVAGSPANYVGLPYAAGAMSVAAFRSPNAAITPALFALIDPIVKKQCDALDGVKDGLIQNPAKCDFDPERDLPHCAEDQPGGQCFTKAQRETVSTIISAVVDEKGNVVQPGYSVSELQISAATAPLREIMLRAFVHGNDPNFRPDDLFTFRYGGPGPVKGFHAVVSSAEVAKARRAIGMGTGEFPEEAGNLFRENRKFLIWNNFSDGTLIPYTAVNYYRRLARLHGGYAQVQKNVRLFMLPGTDHCSITGVGPNSIDALSAMENWVEKGTPPEALIASVADHQFTPGAPKSAAMASPGWTMPLCKFPEMARYGGKGDLKDSKNWSCRADDRRLLELGESGIRAGVVD